MNGDGRKGIALALLAVLVGAIVQVTQSDGPFTTWQSIVGLIMVFTTLAYGSDISRGFSPEALAFAMIAAVSCIFSFGFLLDQLYLIPKGYLSGPNNSQSVAGWWTISLHDEIYFGLWIALTVVILFFRAAQRS